jgi:threonine synthase
MTSPAYIDPHTGKTYALTQPRWRSDDGNPLMTTDLPGIGRGDIDSSVRSLWRYAKALPLIINDPITMG